MSMTPEAKLLELIKKGSSARSPAAIVRNQAGAWVKNAAAKLRARARRFAERAAHLTPLQHINRLLLAAVSVCLMAALAGLVSSRLPDPSGALRPAGSPRSRGRADVRTALPLASLTQRNLFKPLVAPPPAAPRYVAPPEPVVAKVPLSERLVHLRLVGIMSTTPLQAILEDQRNQKTIYVSAGQSVGDVQVESVLNDQVILTSETERLALTL